MQGYMDEWDEMRWLALNRFTSASACARDSTVLLFNCSIDSSTLHLPLWWVWKHTFLLFSISCQRRFCFSACKLILDTKWHIWAKRSPLSLSLSHTRGHLMMIPSAFFSSHTTMRVSSSTRYISPSLWETRVSLYVIIQPLYLNVEWIFHSINTGVDFIVEWTLSFQRPVDWGASLLSLSPSLPIVLLPPQLESSSPPLTARDAALTHTSLTHSDVEKDTPQWCSWYFICKRISINSNLGEKIISVTEKWKKRETLLAGFFFFLFLCFFFFLSAWLMLSPTELIDTQCSCENASVACSNSWWQLSTQPAATSWGNGDKVSGKNYTQNVKWSVYHLRS